MQTGLALYNLYVIVRHTYTFITQINTPVFGPG